jgi:hypothetical protein
VNLLLWILGAECLASLAPTSVELQLQGRVLRKGGVNLSTTRDVMVRLPLSQPIRDNRWSQPYHPFDACDESLGTPLRVLYEFARRRVQIIVHNLFIRWYGCMNINPIHTKHPLLKHQAACC